MTPEKATALFQMRCKWGESYPISFADGVWAARRSNGPANVLAADTAEELNWLIRSDYGRWLQEPAGP